MCNGPTPILEVRDLVKRFGGVTALDRVCLSVAPGEVHGVIGENGAGKSTLMKILAGVEHQDAGQVLVDGRPQDLDTVQTALDHGIALIHQELNLADNLDVGANIFLGREPRRYGFIKFGQVGRDARRYLRLVGIDVSPTTLVSTLPIGMQQLVEIAKTLSVDARILIMDEPTSSLSQHEAKKLFEVIAMLRESGVTVIYISHRLSEIERVADRVTVLRDGQQVGTLIGEDINHDTMVERMVGRDIAQFYPRTAHQVGEVGLEVRRLRTSKWPSHPLDLAVRAGEVVGVAGLVGAGRSEMLHAIFGVERPVSGKVRVAGHQLKPGSCRDAIAAGVALVPEDRKHQGLILEMGVRSNLGLSGLSRHRLAGGFLNRRREREDAARMIDELQIKASSDLQLAQHLSGGNQQKVVIGKWLSMNPRVMLLDEPTRGVDVGAKQEIYRLLEHLARAGVAILFASSEMEEIVSMSDRVVVMHEGRITGQLTRRDLSEEAIMSLATGRPNGIQQADRPS